MDPLDLVKLKPLMEKTMGRSEIAIGLIDGPIALPHPDLADTSIRPVNGTPGSSCRHSASAACSHGTMVAGVLLAKRGSAAPAICPGCSFLVYSVFGEDGAPVAAPDSVANAILAVIEAGARVINLSAALPLISSERQLRLEEALNLAARKGVVVVAAAGNEGLLGSSSITCHPWVIPVAGCDAEGRPLKSSNLGRSTGQRGLSAPAEGITTLGAGGHPARFDGTSAATPFVTGTIALLWSEFPGLNGQQVRQAVTQSGLRPRQVLFPRLLDASAAYRYLAKR